MSNEMAIDLTGDDDYGMPDSEHVEMVFQGLEDTVTGTEGFELTAAQRYTYAIMEASDSLTREQRRDGNESFFGSIGNGIKAVWDYIMKMFRAIYNYFFGSGENSAETKEKKAEEKLTKAIKAIDEVKQKKWSTGVDESWGAMSKIQTIEDLDRFMGVSNATSSEASAIADIVKNAPDNPTPSEKAKVVEAVAQKLVRINGRAKQHLSEMVDRMQAENDVYTKSLDNNKGEDFEGTEFKELYTTFKDAFMDASALVVVGFKQIHDLNDATKALQICQKMLGSLNADRLMFKSHKDQIVNRIKGLELRLGKIKPTDKSPEAIQFRKDLAACKKFMSLLTGLTKRMESRVEAFGNLSTTICKLFGIKVAH